MRWMICVVVVVMAAGPAGAEEGSVVLAQIGRSMCSAYQPAVEAAIGYGQQGLPLSAAESVIESAYNLDARLWSFLRESVQVAYQNPDALGAALRDGRWLALCEQALRR
ncbi:hypothetical protein SAMN05444336_106157 [Albimonas donghaensis]|uniref:HdeA/HdeB family protein n=1 Tax=Albimonas donghaensis TaxID=356660 RepID=A0A1H3CM72_9RHOB|nr:hypothetical protein [Albimonas donghaensis]SDX55195.1 hypothetical protein SAMN05444336_106157 [Albimonas donghaensis]